MILLDIDFLLLLTLCAIRARRFSKDFGVILCFKGVRVRNWRDLEMRRQTITHARSFTACVLGLGRI